MAPRKDHTPEALAEARRLYERTLTPVTHIMAMLGISKPVFYQRLKMWGWRRRRAKDGAFELARGLSELADGASAPQPAEQRPVTPERRQALAERIQSVIERAMTLVEQSFGLLKPSDQPEAERVLRTVAVMSRTVVDVAALNQSPDAVQADDSDDDAIPSDIDAFREEVAQRIRSLIEARQR